MTVNEGGRRRIRSQSPGRFAEIGGAGDCERSDPRIADRMAADLGRDPDASQGREAGFQFQIEKGQDRGQDACRCRHDGRQPNSLTRRTAYALVWGRSARVRPIAAADRPTAELGPRRGTFKKLKPSRYHRLSFEKRRRSRNSALAPLLLPLVFAAVLWVSLSSDPD
jgi:hypothetical protein